MAAVYRLCVGIVTALALCKYCLAEWNATEESAGNRTVPRCHHHGNGDNCTVSPSDTADTGQWSGHFSKCPEEFSYYCVHGECRYVEEQKAASCRCLPDFEGHRCEFVKLGRRGERQLILISCIIAGLLFIIFLIVFVCICSHRRYRLCWRRRRRREEPRNGTEKLRMMDTGAAHATSTPDAAETSHTNSV